MKEFLGWALAIVVTIAGFIALAVAVGFLDLGMMSFFAPKYKEVQHEVFKNSTQHIEGIADDLADYKFQMITAETDAERRAIAEVVNHRFANADESKIESLDLVKFLNDCKSLKLDEYKGEE